MISKENLALTLLVTGQCSQTEKLDTENAVTKAIEIFSVAAVEKPQSLLQSIKDTVEVKIDGMTMIALAVLVSKAQLTFLQKDKIADSIIMLLTVYGPPKILEFVELVKSKIFGRGFGSRPQRWIRSTMESWSSDTIKKYSEKHPKELYSLIILVHPRYNGNRGILIRNFLNSDSFRQVAKIPIN